MFNPNVWEEGVLYFDPEKHEYWLNGKLLISTTQLLQKHGLSVDYSDIAPSILEAAAEFGNRQHKELENYFKGIQTYENVNDITREGIDLLKQEGIEAVFSEQRATNGLVAGTIDLVGIQSEQYVMVDYKFTSALYSNPVTWQANIYKNLLYDNYQIGVSKLYVLWYDKQNAEFKLRELPILEDSMIEKLYNYEREGKNYTKEQGMILYNVGNQLELNKVLNELKEAQDYVKSIENQAEIIKEELMLEMEKHGVASFDLDNHRVTYVRPTKTVRTDYKRLLSDNKDIDESKYQFESERKGYIRFNEIKNKSRREVLAEIKEKNMSDKWKKKVVYKKEKKK